MGSVGIAFSLRSALLVLLLVLIVACLTISIHMVFSNSNASNIPTSSTGIRSNASNAPVLNAKILVITDGRNPAGIIIVKMLRQHFNEVQVSRYDEVGDVEESGGLPKVLVLVLSSNGSIPIEERVVSIAKKVLRCEGLLVVANLKPLNKSMLIRFLKQLELDAVTLSNIESAIHTKRVDVSNGRYSYVDSDVYVFALSLGEGKYPYMYIFSADVGAKVIPIDVCNFIVKNTVLNYLQNEISKR